MNKADKDADPNFEQKIKLTDYDKLQTMFKTNEYYNGNVKSIAFETKDGSATIGVMAAGEYNFGTSVVEHMKVTSGELLVMQPGETEWKAYKPFETFVVDKGVTFKVKAETDASYFCLYR